MSQDIAENIKLLLQVFGGACFMGLIIGIFGVLLNTLSDKIDSLHYEYTLKHRFDKPPTAKCYCVDCIHYKDGKCLRLQDFYVGEAWFCWDAEPKRKAVKNDRK